VARKARSAKKTTKKKSRKLNDAIVWCPCCNKGYSSLRPLVVEEGSQDACCPECGHVWTLKQKGRLMEAKAKATVRVVNERFTPGGGAVDGTHTLPPYQPQNVYDVERCPNCGAGRESIRTPIIITSTTLADNPNRRLAWFSCPNCSHRWKRLLQARQLATGYEIVHED